jgi:hypothetical protein
MSKFVKVGAAECVRGSRDQDAASTCVLRPRMGTGLSCYFGGAEIIGVRSEVQSRREILGWKQRGCRGYDWGF